MSQTAPDLSHIAAAVYRLNAGVLLIHHVKAVQTALEFLPVRERRALELRFGIYDGQVRTVAEVAAILPMHVGGDRTVPASPPAKNVEEVIALALLRVRHDLGLIPQR